MKSLDISRNNKKSFQMPHIFIILFSFIFIVSLLTYIIPAGSYDRTIGVEGRSILISDSYKTIPKNPISLLELFVAIPKGFVEAGWVIVLTFCVGGGFLVVKKTGIIYAAISWMAKKLRKRGLLIIPILMTVFAIIDAFIGMPELCLVYVPILLPLTFALGFDSITAVAIALIGSAAGFTAALTNPFTIGIAQKIAGLPLYSGAGYRVLVLVITLTVGIIFVVRYAKRVRANPESSLMFEADKVIKEKFLGDDEDLSVAIGGRQIIAGVSAVLLFILLIFGVFLLGWDMPEIGGIFIAIGVVSGLIAGLSGEEISEAFLEGCKDVLMGALIIGIARGIIVIMVESQIIDTVIYGLSLFVQFLPAQVTSVGMLIVQSFFNFLVPSGSGQTVITMPIMAPLADLVGVTRQTAVLALQFGDGISNIFYPTSGYFMASLAIARVPWDKWAKFMLPLFLIWSGLGAVFLIIAQAIQWGPF